MEVRTPITVRYADTDMMGVVYHANYLLYFEDARMDFLARAAMGYADVEAAGYVCPVVGIEISYREALRYGERAYTLTCVEESRPTRTTYRHEVYREGMDEASDRPLVSARVTVCIVERGTFRPVSIKRALPDLYAALKRAARPLAGEEGEAAAVQRDST